MKHSRFSLSFLRINRGDILTEILKLETSKACQDNDIPTQIIKENTDMFAGVHLLTFNDSVKKFNFSSSFPP